MKKIIALLLIAFAIGSIAVFVIAGFYSGWPYRAPHAFGYGPVKICIAQSYRLSELNPTYGLSHEQALSKLQESANVWNRAAGCTMLEYDENGGLEIRLMNPDEAPEGRIGRYSPPLDVIQIFDTRSIFLVELIAHEMGHALDLDHVEVGVMAEGGWWCSYGKPCPSDFDRAELRRNYPLLR